MKKLGLVEATADDVVKLLSSADSSDCSPFKQVCAEMDDYTWEVITPHTFNKELVGNWFLYRNNAGDLFVTRDTPTIVKNFPYIPAPKLSGWMQLECNSGTSNIAPTFQLGKWTLRPSDFNKLKLPRVKDGTCIEIEIMPSGKVYFY